MITDVYVQLPTRITTAKTKSKKCRASWRLNEADEGID